MSTVLTSKRLENFNREMYTIQTKVMLTPQVRSQFVTKVLTSNNGDKYRVVFLVTMVDGTPRGQVVSAELISTAYNQAGQSAQSQSSENFILPEPAKKSPQIFTYKPTFSGIISPLSFLDFFMSQPTRAPSLA